MTPGVTSRTQRGAQLVPIIATGAASGGSFILRQLEQTGASDSLLWPHLTSCIALTWVLGKAVVLGLSPPPGYAITQKLPAAPKPHTEFPNKTCENRSPVAALATFGNCLCPWSTSRLSSPRHYTPGAKEAWTDPVFETHPGKICPGTHGFDVFLLAPSKPNEAEYLCCGLSLYCRCRLIPLQQCSNRKALLLPTWPHVGSECLLLPVWKLVLMWPLLLMPSPYQLSYLCCTSTCFVFSSCPLVTPHSGPHFLPALFQ